MNEYFREPTKEEKEKMAEYYRYFKDKGFNLYVFVSKIRKLKGYFPPPELILKTCASAKKSNAIHLWGYFIKTLQSELPKHFADLNIQEAKEYKKPSVFKIKDLFNGLT